MATPIDPEKVKEIAGKLTVAQREVIQDPRLKTHLSSAPPCWIGDVNMPQTRVCRSLVRKGLVQEQRGFFRINNLGLAVRQYLEKKSG